MKALIVDDSPMMRTLIRRAAEKRGLEVAEAGNYDETISTFASYQPDIVFLDIIMDTKRSGIEALKHIKSEKPDTTVVMVTSVSNQERIVKECIDYGAEEYVNKPFKEGELLDIIDSIMKG